MKRILPEKLLSLAENCPLPLYVVGGSVRDFLAGYPLPAHPDWDISSPMDGEAFVRAAEACGMQVRAVYANTGTVKLTDGAEEYEFTRFRSDKYIRGLHVPSETFFTEDISLDARRRDFCANAVYYDIKAEKFCDPLGGIEDIRKRTLRTVREPEKVFGEDGLRLLRLARIAAQTGFSPDGACLAGARANALLIRDIFPERIFAELRSLLLADAKHGDRAAPYRGLCILRDTGVLKEILPELSLGDGMAQNAAYHDHDVLEHSLRCVLYSPQDIRFAALLHDVGKPFCRLRDGNSYAHAEEGARIAGEILTRLKAPAKLIGETVFLVREHMYDFDMQAREIKVRRKIIACGDRLPSLLALKQADFSACKDDESVAPVVKKWQEILSRMRAEGVPFSVRELRIPPLELQALGVPREHTQEALSALLAYCTEDGRRNTASVLERYTKTHLI